MKNIKIGREPDNQLVLPPDDRISRYHATLEVHDDGSMILKDHSKNGTNVNGYQLSNASMPVQRGATVMFAGVARLDWNLVDSGSIRILERPGNNTRSNNLNLLWIALPILAILGGLGYMFRCPLFGKDCDNPGKEPIAVRVSKHYDKSVGLIFHAYYYKRKIAGNRTIFIGLNKKKYENEGKSEFAYSTTPDVLLPFVSTGTGWLINSEEGNLVTNRHVISPSWTANRQPSQIEPEIKAFMDELKGFIYTIETVYLKVPPTTADLETHTSMLKFLPTGTDLLIQNDATLTEILQNVSSTGINAQALCYHEESEVDLALLRVGNITNGAQYKLIEPTTEIKTTPDSLQGSPVVLLGYSGGLTVGYDNIRRKVNRTIQQGLISDSPSTYAIRYGIDTEGGSSGSPVFNDEEKLVAIHFAGRKNSGFGIPARYVTDLLKHENVVDISGE